MLKKILTAIKRRRDKNPVAVILMYHRILPDRGEDSLNVTVSLDRFRSHLDMLNERFDTIRLDELARRSKGDASPRKTVVITFDDGYRDNFEHAFPALKAAGLPATFFVPTDFIGRDVPLFDERLRFVIENGERKQLRIPDRAPFPLSTEEERHLAVHGALQFLHLSTEPEKEEWLKRWQSGLRPGEYVVEPVNLPMTWDQLRKMHEQGMLIGSHGRSHRSLASLSPNDLEAELQGSARCIERHLGQADRFFSYPYGRSSDVTPEAVDRVNEAGYLFACTASQGPVFQDDSPLLLRRLEVSDWPATNFAEAIEHTFRMETHAEEFCI